jgi:tetratricopeptide (TPR) repeat protein
VRSQPRQTNHRRVKEIRAVRAATELHEDPVYATAVKTFEAALTHFRKQRYARAKELFEKLTGSAPAGIADRAKVHLSLCLQRLTPPTSTFETAEDYYVAGISELNARRFGQAVEWLAKASRLRPAREEVQYALASAYALQGNIEAAIAHLKASIELRPQNAYEALRDADLRTLSSDPRFIDLVHPDRNASARTRFPSESHRSGAA